jgi:hypothetical protein
MQGGMLISYYYGYIASPLRGLGSLWSWILIAGPVFSVTSGVRIVVGDICCFLRFGPWLCGLGLFPDPRKSSGRRLTRIGAGIDESIHASNAFGRGWSERLRGTGVGYRTEVNGPVRLTILSPLPYTKSVPGKITLTASHGSEKGPSAAPVPVDTSDEALAVLLGRLKAAVDPDEIRHLSDQIERVIFHKQFTDA